MSRFVESSDFWAAARRIYRTLPALAAGEVGVVGGEVALFLKVQLSPSMPGQVVQVIPISPLRLASRPWSADLQIDVDLCIDRILAGAAEEVGVPFIAGHCVYSPKPGLLSVRLASASSIVTCEGSVPGQPTLRFEARTDR